MKKNNFKDNKIVAPIIRQNTSIKAAYDLNEAEKRVEKILKKLKLTPEVNPKRFFSLTKGYKHRYFSICKYKNKKVFFSCVVKYDKLTIESFKKEYKLAKLINSSLFSCPNYLPRYLKISLKDLCFVQEYIPSYTTLQNKNKIFEINPSINIIQAKKLSEKLVKIIYEINIKLFNKFFPKLKIEKSNIEEIIKEIIKKILPSLKIKGLLNLKNIKLISQFLLKYKSLLEESNLYFNHGDLHPGNILFSSAGEIKIVDWETYHLNNLLYDITYFYSHLYGSEAFRKKILIDFFKLIPNKYEKKSKILFRSNIIILSLKYINYGLFLELNEKDFQMQKRWFINLINENLKQFTIL